MISILLIIVILLYGIWALRKIYIDKKKGKCCGSSMCTECIIKGKCRK